MADVYRFTLTVDAPDGSTHVETVDVPATDWARMGPTEIMVQVLIPLHASVRERWFRQLYVTPGAVAHP